MQQHPIHARQGSVAHGPPREPWWNGALLYQIYPRSFADSNDDGVGDLPGILSRLDYLKWVGVDGIWLNPTFPSPNRDWGYDVADYLGVHPDLGTLDDLDALVAAAGARDIRVLLDLVPAHTSDRHPWFQESRSSRDSSHRDWYIWRDQVDEQQSLFGGDAWTYDDATGQHYHHLFLREQPDLNWLNTEVRNAFEEIMRFWFDRAIAGFRIDVVNEVVKDPPDRANFPRIHELLRDWRRLAEDYDPERLLLGETWVLDLRELVSFYGAVDELQLALNFPFMFAGLEARALEDVVNATEELLPPRATPVWALSNHDVVRFPTRICEEKDARARCALLILLTARYVGPLLGRRARNAPGRDSSRAGARRRRARRGADADALG